MGFPIRSNIFVDGSSERALISRFPLQVAVLFRPQDAAFREQLKQLLPTLDRLTGRRVAFFAVLDPPPGWLRTKLQRQWWATQAAHTGRRAASYDDAALVMELGELFGIPWEAMPALFVSRQLWAAGGVCSSTSASTIERQFAVLSELGGKGKTSDLEILDALATVAGLPADSVQPDEQRVSRLAEVYATLAGRDRSDRLNLDRLVEEDRFDRFDAERLVESERHDSEVTGSGEDFLAAYDDVPSLRREWAPPFDALRRVPPLLRRIAGQWSSAAVGVIRRLMDFAEYRRVSGKSAAELDLISTDWLLASLAVREEHHDVVYPRGLDPRCAAWFDEARRIARLLECLEHERQAEVDFSPAAQCLWKMLEYELNLSMVQVARLSRGARLPEFFALYDPAFPAEQACVRTGPGPDSRECSVDINQRETRALLRDRHRFLTLGEAWHVRRALHTTPGERLDGIVEQCLGRPLPGEVIQIWKHVMPLRNVGTHTGIITRAHWKELHTLLSDRLFWQPLTTIKDRMAGRLKAPGADV